jgi:tetratricopeptide (TPR) repeat protein
MGGKRILALVAAVGISLGGAHLYAEEKGPIPPSRAETARHLSVKGFEEEGAGRGSAAAERFGSALKAALKKAETAREEKEKAAAWAAAEVFLHRYFYLQSKAQKRKEGLRALKALAAQKLPAHLQAWIRWYAGFLELSLGNVEGCRAEIAPLGFVHRWWIAGPFDNERGGGFNVAYGPEKAIDLRASYRGKVRKVAWRFVDIRPNFGMVDLDAMLRPNDEVLAYALTYIHSEAEMPVAFRIASDEGFKFWLNDELMLGRDVNRSIKFDQDAVGARLRKGWNKVLLKITEQKKSWGFRFRVTTPEGEPIRGLRVANRAEVEKGIKHAKGTEKVPVIRGGLDFLEKRVAEDSVDPWSAFYCGYLLFVLGAHDENDHPDREAYKKAVEADPSNWIFRTFYSFSLASKGEMSVHREENHKRRELERVLELDPKNAEAAYLLARYYLSSIDNRKKAEAYLARALEANPDYFDALMLKGRLLGKRGWSILAKHHYRKMAENELFARSARLRRRLAEIDRSEERLRDAAIHLREGLVRHFADRMSRRKLANIYESLGFPEEAIKEWAVLKVLNPFRIEPYMEEARVRAAYEKFDEAIAACRGALQLAPEDDDVYEILGRYLHRAGREKEAFEAWQKALELNPKRVKLRRYIKFLRKEEKDYEEPFVADPEDVIAGAKAIPVDPDNPYRFLYRLKVSKVNPDGTKSEFYQELIRVENDDGITQLDVYRVPYAAGEQKVTMKVAEVHQPDGTVDEAPIRTYDWGSFSRGDRYYLWEMVDLPPLGKGDVVRVEYRLDDLRQSFFGDYFGDIFYFQHMVPMEQVKYVLIRPADRQMYFNYRNLDATPVTETRPEKKQVVSVWEQKGVEKIEPEPAMPSRREVLSQLQISTFKDWKAFGRWYWNLIKKQHEVSDEIREKVRELTASAKNDRDKIRAIYNFVVTEIRYNDKWEFGVHGFKPYNAASIFRRKFGDCKDKATLINTMLGEIGITAYPVLINMVGAERRWKEDLALPLIRHFNHCISYVPPQGGQEGFFLDGTAQYHSFGILPTGDYGAAVFVAMPEGGEVLPIPFPGSGENSIRESYRIRLSQDGGATVEAALRPGGEYDVLMRYAFSVVARRELILNRIYGRMFAGARVVRKEGAPVIEFSELKDLDRPVEARYALALPKLLKRTSRGYSLEEVKGFFFLLYGGKLSNYATKTTRTYDVILPIPKAMELELRYEIPKTFKVIHMPKPRKIEMEFGTYRKSYEAKEGEIVVRKRIAMAMTRVPVDKYAAFRRFVNEVDRAEEEKIILGKEGK